ncbi:hypothetical protein AnigIFM63326_003669 [Aspergillus niger]|nr:hypothetical protein AnigIFM63326_003669 [Aspergillus niger]
MAVGTNLQCSSYSLAQMFVGRVVISLGNGMNTATARIWQTETSPAHWRRRLVILEMVMNIAGFSLVNWIKYGLSFRGGAVAWRIPTAFQFIFIFILFGTVPWLPESPRWLMQQGRTGEAVEVIACIEDKSVDDPYITTQRSEIEYTIQYERDNDVSWRDLFSRKKTNDTNTLRRLLLITNFVIVEITPIGIQNIGWKFWVVWTVFNAVFSPVIYFFYPETANRTLEDLDAYYRSNPPLIVINDPDAISVKRPLKRPEERMLAGKILDTTDIP